MNIIDAWKKAKGKRIHRNIGDTPWTTGDFGLRNFLTYVNEESLLADDWEVVKEKKDARMNMMQLRDCIYKLHHIPDDAKVTIEWEE